MEKPDPLTGCSDKIASPGFGGKLLHPIGLGIVAGAASLTFLP
jgi:hypothetical protein